MKLAFIFLAAGLTLPSIAGAENGACEDPARKAALAAATRGTLVYVAEEFEAASPDQARYQISVVDSIADAESFELFDISLNRSDCSVVSLISKD